METRLIEDTFRTEKNVTAIVRILIILLPLVIFALAIAGLVENNKGNTSQIYSLAIANSVCALLLAISIIFILFQTYNTYGNSAAIEFSKLSTGRLSTILCMLASIAICAFSILIINPNKLSLSSSNITGFYYGNIILAAFIFVYQCFYIAIYNKL